VIDLVLTLIGPDRPGLVEALAERVAAHGGNWLESRMAHLAGRFAGILRVEVPPANMAALHAALQELESLGLNVVAESGGNGPPTEARILELEFVGQDHPGIVRAISHALLADGVNIEELTTERRSAPMSGDLLFSARARVRLPADLEAGRLRAGLERIANDLMVELKLAER
jgi:glycine cleavage system regulatory protein